MIYLEIGALAIALTLVGGLRVDVAVEPDLALKSKLVSLNQDSLGEFESGQPEIETVQQIRFKAGALDIKQDSLGSGS